MNSKSKLSEYKRAVLTTITMRLTRKEALDYLREHGYPISNSTLRKNQKRIKKKRGYQAVLRRSISRNKEKIEVRFCFPQKMLRVEHGQCFQHVNGL